MKDEEMKLISYYGCYFISNPGKEEYLMIDIPNSKLRPIDNDCFKIIETLNELKKDIENYGKHI